MDAPVAAKRRHRKRGPRNRKRPNSNKRAPEAQTVAQEEPAKRQRLQQDEAQQQPEVLPESADDRAEDVLSLLVAPTRLHQEMVYMGSTRAVIGPGFVVRELLFGEEYSSMRITAPWNPADEQFVRDAAKLGVFAKALKDAKVLVDAVEIDPVATKATTTTERTMTVHLSSKHHVPSFLKQVRTFAMVVDGLKTDRVIAQPPLSARPAVLAQKALTGCVSVSWAAGIATGGAQLLFPNAGTANAFLQSYIAGQLKLPTTTRVGLYGYRDDEALSPAQRALEQQKKRQTRWLAPLMMVQIGQEHASVHVYDEDKIGKMSATELINCRFVALISAGLPAEVNEKGLLEMVHPHQCATKIQRKNDPLMPLVTSVQRQTAILQHPCSVPLRSCLVPGEELSVWDEKNSKLDSVRVKFTDLGRLVQVYEHVAQSSHWETVEKPYAQPIQVEITYTFQASVPKDIYRCLEKNINQVKVFARNNGVKWCQDRISSDTSHVIIVLRCVSREAVERVERALNDAIESEPFINPVISLIAWSQSKWRKLECLAYQAVRGRKDVCVRTNRKERLIWLYGEKEVRRDVLRKLQNECLQHQKEATQRTQARGTAQPNVEVDCGVCMSALEEQQVQFTTCGHKFCVGCIQPGVTPSNALPLICPVQNCSRAIHMNDILKISPDTDALLEIAVFDYVGKHPDECSVCPKPGCNQILSRTNFEQDKQYPDSQYTVCETCTTSYCLSCSQATSRAVEHHEGVTCEEQQLAGSQVVDHHVQILRDNILTLRCPHCKSAFLDFDGCLSVVCGNVTCRRHFCGGCLVFSDLDTQITHDHVKVCAKNPQQGGHFLSAEELSAVHREHRVDKLREHLATIEAVETRHFVLKRVANDLSDLGLPEPSHFM